MTVISKEIDSVRLGNNSVSSIYLGVNKVWPPVNSSAGFWYGFPDSSCVTITLNSSATYSNGLYFDDGSYSGVTIGSNAYSRCFGGGGGGGGTPITGNVTVSLGLSNSVQHQSFNTLVGQSFNNWTVDGQTYGGPYGPGYGYVYYGYSLPDGYGQNLGSCALETNGNGHWFIGNFGPPVGTFDMNTRLRATGSNGQVYAYNLFYNIHR
jgi:hypothetical protein